LREGSWMSERLAIITTHPIQYQAPLWRALAKTPGIDVMVYFGSDFCVRGVKDPEFGVHFSWDVPLTEGYPHTFLSTDPGISRVEDLKLNISEFKEKLLEFHPNCALVNAYSPLPFYLKAILTLRLLGIPVLLRAETTDVAVHRSALKAFSRNVFLKLLYSQIAGFLAIGYNSRHHYMSRKILEHRIFSAPYNVDNHLLEKQIKDYGGMRAEIRRELGFAEDQFVFIFSGKLIPKKNPLLMVEALRLLTGSGGIRPGLIVMGDGLLRRDFEAGIAAIPEITAVFTGFQNQSKLGRFYSAADCLVLPSQWEETWGLVVNEALHFGIPAIVSDRVGCWRDLVIAGKTGYVFPTGDAAALADCMGRTMSLVRLRGDSIREACRQKAEEYSVEQAVTGIRRAVSAI
jgi:glycosyltransferase involved in cell wall biosynthesis